MSASPRRDYLRAIALDAALGSALTGWAGLAGAWRGLGIAAVAFGVVYACTNLVVRGVAREFDTVLARLEAADLSRWSDFVRYVAARRAELMASWLHANGSAAVLVASGSVLLVSTARAELGAAAALTLALGIGVAVGGAVPAFARIARFATDVDRFRVEVDEVVTLDAQRRRAEPASRMTPARPVATLPARPEAARETADHVVP